MNDMTCEIDDNFIGIADNIMSAEDCKQECENNSECRIYSYYGLAGAPFRSTCLLFRDCSVLSPVEDCVTEETECATSASFCYALVEGTLGDNVIDIKPDVSEAACEAECEVEEECQFFTFHFSNATVYPNTCFLLSQIQEPITACQDQTCISGSSKCESSLCGFLENENGVLFPNGIIVNATRNVSMLTIGPCSADINVLAVVVGGGGTSVDYTEVGSGSGYIEFQEIQFARPYVQLEAIVGSASKESILRIVSYGSSDDLITALPGGDGSNENRNGDGANGYSGGGCDGGYEVIGGIGGSDGSDGGSVGNYNGGKGSGLDIRSIPITNFELR